jgi:uncharacterized protein (DUF1501 family)
LGSRIALASPQEPGTSDVIVVVFLRGGADGLNLVAPTRDPLYQLARPTLRVPTPEELSDPADRMVLSAGGPIAPFESSGAFSFHPGMRALYDGPWSAGNLAIIHNAGLIRSLTTNRSHFEAQRIMELASLDETGPGFANRYLDALGADGPVAGVAKATNLQRMLAGPETAVAMGDPATFGVRGFANNALAQQALLAFHDGRGRTEYGQMADRAAAAIGVVSGVNWSTVAPANGAVYDPAERISVRMKEVAALIRSGVGVRIATVDMENWDTHAAQGAPTNPAGTFRLRASALSNALAAFSKDCGSMMNEVTVIVMSEFGRTIKENGSGGTDHGRGGLMMVMGKNVRGGIWGRSPMPLAADSADGDLPVENDYRDIVSEVLVNRGGVASTEAIFPSFTPRSPLGFISS